LTCRRFTAARSSLKRVARLGGCWIVFPGRQPHPALVVAVEPKSDTQACCSMTVLIRLEERRTMSSEQNKTIVRRLLEEPWKGDLRVVDELIDRNYVGYDPSIPEPRRGPDGFKENVSTYREAYSDARITVDDQIAEGDKVATRWTGRGKHDGDLMGVAPTGKQVKVSGLTLSRLANGKVIEDYTNWDTFGMMQQLGIVPELAHA